MKITIKLMCAVAASSLLTLASQPAQALTMPECSAKYKAAQIQKGGGYYSECTKRLKGGTV